MFTDYAYRWKQKQKTLVSLKINMSAEPSFDLLDFGVL